VNDDAQSRLDTIARMLGGELRFPVVGTDRKVSTAFLQRVYLIAKGEGGVHTYRCEEGHEHRSTQKVEKQQCQTCFRPAYREPCR